MIPRKYDSVLSRNPLFEKMSAATAGEAVELLSGFMVSHKKGEILHRAGEKMSRFGLVLRGSVQACCDDMEGNRVIMAEVSPGVTFGESICYLGLQDTQVYIIAAEDSEVLWLSLEKLGSDERSQELRRRFTSLLAKRALAMHDRILILSQTTIRDKLRIFFAFMRAEADSDTFVLPFSREDMAAYIGSNRSALSRELTRMRREGLIRYKMDEFTILQKNL